MTVKSSTYGTVAGVEARVGFVVETRHFTETTTPSVAQAERYLDQVADELNGRLAARGYPVPAVDTDFKALLARINEDGAAVYTAMSHPYEADPEREERSPISFWKAQYEAGLKLIDSRLGEALGESLNGPEPVSGSYKNADGKVKLPLFTREMTDVPGSRSLTE